MFRVGLSCSDDIGVWLECGDTGATRVRTDRVGLGEVGWGRFLDIGLCLFLDVLSESLVSSELFERFEGDGHSSVSDSDEVCGPSEGGRSVVGRGRFGFGAGIGVPSHIRSRIMATSLCLTQRLSLGLSSSSSRSCRLRAGFLS